MKLLHKLTSWYHASKSAAYSRKAKQLHAEMRQMMTPYMERVDYCDKQARIHRIIATVALGKANDMAVPKLDYSSDITAIVLR